MLRVRQQTCIDACVWPEPLNCEKDVMMELNDREIIATDDLGRPIYGQRKLLETKFQTTMEAPVEKGKQRLDAWNCGIEPSGHDNTKPPSGMRRRNPGLAFASTPLPEHP